MTTQVPSPALTKALQDGDMNKDTYERMLYLEREIAESHERLGGIDPDKIKRFASLLGADQSVSYLGIEGLLLHVGPYSEFVLDQFRDSDELYSRYVTGFERFIFERTVSTRDLFDGSEQYHRWKDAIETVKIWHSTFGDVLPLGNYCLPYLQQLIELASLGMGDLERSIAYAKKVKNAYSEGETEIDKFDRGTFDRPNFLYDSFPLIAYVREKVEEIKRLDAQLGRRVVI